MEEIKVIMEALVKMSDGAQTVFIIWCLKEVIGYLICPLTFFVIGKMVYQIATTLQKRSHEHDERRYP